MDIYKLSLIIILSIGMQSAYAKVYKWVDEEGNVKFSDKPHPSQRKTIKAKKKRTPVVKLNLTKPTSLKKKSDNNIPFSQDIILSFRILLDGNRFLDLNETLHAHQTAAENNIIMEDNLFTAYDSFEIKDKSYETVFNMWVDATPDEYQPYLARARFYYRLGWDARGGKWVSETKKEKIKIMEVYLKKATLDIVKVLKIYQKSMVAYSLLIGIYNSLGQVDSTDVILNKALEINKSTFHLRKQYLHFLTPRWGGTYEKMKLFIIESMRYLDKNPKLKLLEGYLYLDLAKMQQTVKKYSVAEQYYDKALEFGVNHKILKERGKNSYRRENYKKALKDPERAIQLYSEDAQYYYWRSKVYQKLEEYKKASFDIERAYELDSNDKYILSNREWLSSKFTYIGYQLDQNQKSSEAIVQFNAALNLDPNNANLYYRKAQALIKENNYEQALDDVDQAIQLNPDNINYYLLIDYLLFKKKDWDKIISYWDNFISRNPDVSRAYVERGGTYYHKGDLKSAVKNAKIAADMGNREGKEAYEKFKKFQ